MNLFYLNYVENYEIIVYFGEMAEWFKALVSKTSMRVISSWVRIPLSPDFSGEYLTDYDWRVARVAE
tara:strand:+ start:17 stop:217 length:201 start_codon:yes stop_codon:yes gene_type:complete